MRIRTVWSVLATSAMCHVCVMCPYIDFKLESWSLGQVLCGVASPGFGEGGEADRSSSENNDFPHYEGFNAAGPRTHAQGARGVTSNPG